MENPKKLGIFLCHSRRDRDIADLFDQVAPRIEPRGMRIYRKEFEDILSPPDQEIARNIKSSTAVFVLVGPGLIDLLNSDKEEWLHTTNWMSFEIGLASANGVDIWVLTVDPLYNFPVLTFDVFMPFLLPDDLSAMKNNIKSSLEYYNAYPGDRLLQTAKRHSEKDLFYCPYESCRREFVSFYPFVKGDRFSTIRCPSCGQVMFYHEGKFYKQLVIKREKLDRNNGV